MSLEPSRIVCTGCNYEAVDYYRPIEIRYIFTDGESIATHRDKGWCYGCATYSDIEWIDEKNLLAELSAKMSKLSAGRDRLGQIGNEIFAFLKKRQEKKQLNHQIEELERSVLELGRLLQMSKKRRFKVRCLECGSDNTAKVTFPPEGGLAHDFQHECGGNLRLIHDESGMRFSFRLITYVLNEEGELLAKE